ncbi:MAG TPA: hypothetical protein VF759_02115 [Allosphingosinicella sp.]
MIVALMPRSLLSVTASTTRPSGSVPKVSREASPAIARDTVAAAANAKKNRHPRIILRFEPARRIPRLTGRSPGN